MDAILQRAMHVELAVFDVDGVLTDGMIYLGSSGEEIKAFHVHDGLGLVLLQKAGIRVAIISARHSAQVSERMLSLGIEYVYQGQEDKRATLLGLQKELGLGAAQTAYVGDDLVDLPAMGEAGLTVAVEDAHARVREQADWITSRPGGRGAAREVCDLLLQARGRYEAVCRELFS